MTIGSQLLKVLPCEGTHAGYSKFGEGDSPPAMTEAGVDMCIHKLNTGSGCNLPGPAGIQLDKCGRPMNQTRHFEQSNTTIHYQFKTYAKTPVMDGLVFQELATQHWDYLMLGGGEWGRYKKMEGDHATQVGDFLAGLIKAFGDKRIIFKCNKGKCGCVCICDVYIYI